MSICDSVEYETKLTSSTGILRLAEFETVYEPAMYEPSAQNPLSPHKLAVVLMVLTIETFLDVTTEE